MTGARAAAVGLLLLGVTGPAGAWPLLGAPVVCSALLLLPGFSLAAVLCDAGTRSSLQRISLAFALSVAAFNVVAAIASAARLSWDSSSWLLAGLCVVLAAVSWVGGPRSTAARDEVLWEWILGLLAVLVLLPTVLRYAGGGVDDWWDLAYVRALADRSVIDFGEPMLGTDRVHPRFSWSAWLLLQGALRALAGAEPVLLQSQVLAPIVCVASVSAAALLARAVFGAQGRTAVLLTTLAVPAWVYGTDALPYFTRAHQDKFVAALVLLPVLVATSLDYIAKPTVRRALVVALSATALCSVHTLVFGVGAMGVLVCVVTALWTGRERRGWYTLRVGSFGFRQAGVLVLLLALTMVPPLWQAWTLRDWFAEQGVGLATPDNPVVRAHLALGRLIAAGKPYMIVNPGALFGPIGLVVAAGACLALRRKREGDGYLVALTFVPAVALFVPLVAAGVGAITVPWMLYRIGWLIPQSLLVARVIAAAFTPERGILRGIVVAVSVAVVVALTVPTAADRLRRGMREHPFQYETVPRGTTLAAYRFLDRADRRGAILAPVGFSNLVPAMTGRSVVAFSERGTLVFAGSESGAYARLRDRATFFSCTTDADARKRIADRYGVAYAVFRRRYRTSGDEAEWLDRATADGVLLAADPALPVACAASAERLGRGLPETWRIVLTNPDYFIVETDAVAGARAASHRESRSSRWLDVVGAEPGDGAGDGEVLASATGYPGGIVSVDPVPPGYGIGSELLWAGGGALWDDGPVEIGVGLKLTGACQVSSVEVVPYLETRSREVFEVRVEDRVRAVQARDGVPMRIALEPRLRDAVHVGVRSRLGLPFGIADLRVVGDRRSCVGEWRPLSRPEVVGHPLSLSSYVAFASAYPRSPRAASALAARVGAATSTEDAIATLRRGLAREPGQAAAWIELGLRLDSAGRFREARDAYRRARAADSNSAWAHGCLAWADLRAGSPLASLWHAWRAVRLDPRYADAVTIAALAWEKLGGTALSARQLERAIEMAPRRAWPYLERARQLARDGRREDARALLRRYRVLDPDDPAASDMLRSLAAGNSTDAR